MWNSLPGGLLVLPEYSTHLAHFPFYYLGLGEHMHDCVRRKRPGDAQVQMSVRHSTNNSNIEWGAHLHSFGNHGITGIQVLLIIHLFIPFTFRSVLIDKCEFRFVLRSQNRRVLPPCVQGSVQVKSSPPSSTPSHRWCPSLSQSWSCSRWSPSPNTAHRYNKLSSGRIELVHYIWTSLLNGIC